MTRDFSMLSGYNRRECDGSELKADYRDGKWNFSAVECHEKDNLREVFLRKKVNGEIAMEKHMSQRLKDENGEFAFDPKTFMPLFREWTIEKQITHTPGKGEKKTLCPKCRKYYAQFYTVKIPMGS